MIEINKCPSCGISDSLISVMPHKIFLKESFIVKCSACEFLWSKNQLDDKELTYYYKKQYRNIKKEEFTFGRFKNDLQRAISQYLFYKKYLPCKMEKIIEIGAGWGVSAKYLYKQGFNRTTIVEPDDRILAMSLNYVDRYDHINDIGSHFFSFIILSHVFEHIYNFDDFFLKILNISTKNSVLFIEVPNCENDYILDNSDMSFHYWFFTKKTLSQILKKYGYQLLEMKFYGKDKFIQTGVKRNHQYISFDNSIKEYESSDDPCAFWIRACFRLEK
jgi:hypothetical protein